MNVSMEALEELKSALEDSANQIESMSRGISDFSKITLEWHDEVGADVNMEMQRIANTAEEPVETLRVCAKKIQAIIDIIKEYK